jgi:hypothetical protein
VSNIQHGAHGSEGRYNRQVLRGAEKLDWLRSLAGQIRKTFYKITLPWSDEGDREYCRVDSAQPPAYRWSVSETLDQSAAALVPELREQINFLAGDNRRNFIDPTMLHMISGALLTLFVSSVLPEFGKAIGRELGTSTASAAHDVVGFMRGLMGGKKADPAQSAKVVESAQAAVPKVPPAQIVIILAGAQANLREQLAAVMPDSVAASLAAQVSEQASRLMGAAPAQ